MKSAIYFLLALIAILGLSACSQQENVKKSDEEKVVETPKDEVPAKEEPPKEEPAADKDQPVSNEKVYHNDAFKDIVVTESGDQFVVTGKAQVFEGVFQYKLYNGDHVLLEDRYQTAGAPSWGDFTISFGKHLITGDDARMELFVYSAKDGSKMNVLDIPIPQK